jgi:hypothetical protein
MPTIYNNHMEHVKDIQRFKTDFQTQQRHMFRHLCVLVQTPLGLVIVIMLEVLENSSGQTRVK